MKSLVLPFILFASLYGSSSIVSLNNNEQEKHFAMPAVYSSSYVDEPNYVTKQKEYAYDLMNFNESADIIRGEGVKVAVIDTGINKNHEDYKVNGESVISSLSKNTTANTPTDDLTDQHGHGSGTASCVYSQINGVGGFGVASNAEAIFYRTSKVSTGAMEYEALERAMQLAIDNNVDVINLSIQGYEHTVSYGGASQAGSDEAKTALKSKIQAAYEAGIVVVASAGNFNTTEPSYPASFEHVISVGALAPQDKYNKAAYSNYSEYVDILAPGQAYTPQNAVNNGYREFSGTSFSAPYVTGAIALYKSKYPSATPDDIERVLKLTADPVDDSIAYLKDKLGAGSLNVEKFLSIAPDAAVVDVADISLTCEDTDLIVGDRVQIVAAGLPDNATNQHCKFVSSDTKVIQVNEKTGQVKATGPGNATVTVSSISNPTVSKTVNFSVAHVLMNDTVDFEIDMPQGWGVGEEDFAFTWAWNNDSEDPDVRVTEPLTLISSDPKVLELTFYEVEDDFSYAYEVRAKGYGTCRLSIEGSISHKTKTYGLEFYVHEGDKYPVSKISFGEHSDRLAIGSPITSSNMPVNANFYNSTKSEVDASYDVSKVMSLGDTRITATYEDKSTFADVFVTNQGADSNISAGYITNAEQANAYARFFNASTSDTSEEDLPTLWQLLRNEFYFMGNASRALLQTAYSSDNDIKAFQNKYRSILESHSSFSDYANLNPVDPGDTSTTVPPVPEDSGGGTSPSSKDFNATPLIIGLAVGGGVLVAGTAILLTVLSKKKK